MFFFLGNWEHGFHLLLFFCFAKHITFACFTYSTNIRLTTAAPGAYLDDLDDVGGETLLLLLWL